MDPGNVRFLKGTLQTGASGLGSSFGRWHMNDMALHLLGDVGSVRCMRRGDDGTH